jgi:fermentation-respiration switch protein FrsA (DUF1100 family)
MTDTGTTNDESSWQRHDVTVTAADGVTLRGWLYAPADAAEAAGAPGVVMTHGFSATRHMGLPGYAEALAAAGIAVLLYDHRNLGASDGAPRGEIDPWAQSLDLRTALAWLAARPEVDGERLGLWGSSFSAGESLAVAAVEPLVKAVVASVPFAGLGDLGPDADVARRERFAAMAQVLTGAVPPPTDPTIGPMPVVREPGSDVAGFLDQPESAEWFLSAGTTGTAWVNEVTVRFSAAPPFDPGVCLSAIAPTPLLMIVATEDRVAATDVALEAFALAGEPKELVMIDGHHFSAYAGPGFETASAATVDFFARHL